MTRPFLRRAAHVAASLLLLALIVAAHGLIPTHDDLTAPISHSGTIGGTVDAERFTLDVDKVELARSVSDEEALGGVEGLEANGVWVVVWATLTSTDATVSVGGTLLEMGDGYSYSANTRLSNTFNNLGIVLNPGLPRYGAFVFEVPEERLSSPTLRVSVQESLDDRLSAQASVDLGLSESDIDRLTEEAADSVAVPPIGPP
ncbi:hypothetical protein HDA32_006030 [Spinactinospora alkalitolerans]|uniref:DUF4352 domain-containing protein n=1 Tax=Spinactinospora alkalitolerans TaxID=687207 RepID=A0A852UAB4_9ACTN|nr:hypothetical protein [Spinactinospora alkalitolerans]NYE50910.1 hypothetical protein [Spinactinospora alkalitolerans]